MTEKERATAPQRLRGLATSRLHIDAAQMKILLRHLHEAVAVQDVTRLVLLLKDLIPDYNPGAQLLKLALSVTSRDAEPAEAQTLFDQTANHPQATSSSA